MNTATRSDATDRDVDESTELLLYWQTDMHRECRVVRSHRAPPADRRPRRIALTATALLLGIATVVAGETTPGEPPMIASGMGERDYGLEFDLREAQRERERAQELEASRADVPARTPRQLANPVTPRGAPAKRAQRPFTHPLPNGYVTSCFGPRWGTQHNGLDVAAVSGTPIVAVAAGTVIQSGWDFTGLGYSVTIRHNNGYISLYGHASRTRVSVGEWVNVGEHVADVGSTGNSSGPHLHLGIARAQTISAMWDSWVDPRDWLNRNGVTIAGCG